MSEIHKGNANINNCLSQCFKNNDAVYGSDRYFAVSFVAYCFQMIVLTLNQLIVTSGYGFVSHNDRKSYDIIMGKGYPTIRYPPNDDN